MKMFRNQSALKIFTLFTAVIFLNMSFFLAEVSMLELKDKQIIENVCNLVLNGGLEEERDAHSGNDTALKVFSMAGENLLLHHSFRFLLASKMHLDAEEHYRHANHSQIFSPPPELIPASPDCPTQIIG